jgi:hypothetical protein
VDIKKSEYEVYFTDCAMTAVYQQHIQKVNQERDINRFGHLGKNESNFNWGVNKTKT